MTIPTKYPVKTQANVSYDWQNLLQQAGYVKYYLVGGHNAEADNYFLSPEVLPASTDNYYITINGTTPASTDFELGITSPAVVAEQKAFFSAVIKEKSGSGTSDIEYTIAIIRKRGATETTIGTSSDEIRLSGNNCKTISIDIDCSTTKLAVDDTLIVRITANEDASQNGAGPFNLYVDPAGRVTQTETTTGVDVTSICYIYIPFRVVLI